MERNDASHPPGDFGVFCEFGKVSAEVPQTKLGLDTGRETVCTVNDELSGREKQGGGLPGKLRLVVSFGNEICRLWKVWMRQ